MKKTGIMGGTFNPVHNAHLALAQCAMEQYELDEVIFMTSGNPPHKRNIDMPDAKIRHEMLKIALEGKEKFVADDYEVNLTDYSYSVITMKHLHEKMSECELYFIIGGDSLRDLPKWYKPHELMKLCTLLVYPRDNEDISDEISEMQNKFGGEIYPVKAPVMDVSSTDIRCRIKAGESVLGMLPKGVGEYIIEHKIYSV